MCKLKGFTPLEIKVRARKSARFLTGPVGKKFSNGAVFTSLEIEIPGDRMIITTVILSQIGLMRNDNVNIVISCEDSKYEMMRCHARQKKWL